MTVRLNKFISKLKNAELVKNSQKLITGNVISQAIALISAPVLYRIYDPADYGNLAMYMTVTNIAIPLSTLQYPQIILLAENDIESVHGYWLNKYINYFFTICSIVLITFVFIINYYQNWNLLMWYIFAPISIFMNGQSIINREWALRKKEYSLLKQNSIILAICVPLISGIIGLTAISDLGLLIGFISGQFISYLLLKKLVVNSYPELNTPPLRHEMFSLALKFKSLPIFTLPSQFLNSVTSNLPNILINNYFGKVNLGYFNLANRILNLPLAIVSNSFGEVFAQQASKENRQNGNFRKTFSQVFKILSVLAILSTMVIVLFGEVLFELFFGIKWISSGEISKILIILISIQIISTPLSYSFHIKNKQKQDFTISILALLVNIALIMFVNFYHLDFYSFIIMFTIFNCIPSFIYLFKSYNYSR